jgi:hypothetical protein
MKQARVDPLVAGTPQEIAAFADALHVVTLGLQRSMRWSEREYVYRPTSEVEKDSRTTLRVLRRVERNLRRHLDEQPQADPLEITWDQATWPAVDDIRPDVLPQNGEHCCNDSEGSPNGYLCTRRAGHQEGPHIGTGAAGHVFEVWA